MRKLVWLVLITGIMLLGSCVAKDYHRESTIADQEELGLVHEVTSKDEISNDVANKNETSTNGNSEGEVSELSEVKELPEVVSKSLADELLEKMTLEEKIGQLFIINPDALQLSTKAYGSIELNSEMQEVLRQYGLGGVALFRANIQDPDQLSKYVSELQKASPYPLFIGIDEEGGDVARIGGALNFELPVFESMETIGAEGNLESAFELGLTIGDYLKGYGFNLDFAPVVDMNTNPENIVIGSRSFGSDPKLVSEMAAEVIKGLHEGSVMACIKHFPGHGDTKGDTHQGYVSVNKTWEQLLEKELIPFIASFDETDMVMMAHITTPSITSDAKPASLSKEIISGKLREELGYEGVIISDAMEMGAISIEYTSAEAAVQGILAGLDIILMPEDFVEAYNGLHLAVVNGEIEEARINESVLRILELKEQYGLLSKE